MTDMKNASLKVIKRFPHWVEPPVGNEDLHDLDWGIIEVLEDRTFRFLHIRPDPDDLEAMIEKLNEHM